MSPDGSRLAFVASAPGARPQLWVQQLETAAAQPLPGTDDATGPFWAPDSRSLAFYARGKLKRVSLGGIRGIDTFAFGVSQPLFATRIPAVLAPFRTNYAVSGDGQRFLVNNVTPAAAPAPITIAVNWQEKWKR